MVGGLALLLGAAVAVWASRTVTRPLRLAMLAARQIANVDLQALTGNLEALGRGDLNHRLEISTQPLATGGNDEVGQLAQAFKPDAGATPDERRIPREHHRGAAGPDG